MIFQVVLMLLVFVLAACGAGGDPPEPQSGENRSDRADFIAGQLVGLPSRPGLELRADSEIEALQAPIDTDGEFAMDLQAAEGELELDPLRLCGEEIADHSSIFFPMLVVDADEDSVGIVQLRNDDVFVTWFFVDEDAAFQGECTAVRADLDLQAGWNIVLVEFESLTFHFNTGEIPADARWYFTGPSSSN